MRKLKVLLQHCLPKHMLTCFAGKLANWKAGKLKTILIKLFIKKYGVNMEEAEHSQPDDYDTFNDFFTRRMRDGTRPIFADDQVLTHPADGTVSQLGNIVDGALIQAKKWDYSALELMGGDELLAQEFDRGKFVTIYLSPKDYHRVHMPCDGRLRRMVYVPGNLFSVSSPTAEYIPNLFTRNERLVCIFDTPFGPVAQVLVGATIVGSIKVVWANIEIKKVAKSAQYWDYPPCGKGVIKLKKGDEMGHFKLGSTVINLFASKRIQFYHSLRQGSTTMVGKPYACRS